MSPTAIQFFFQPYLLPLLCLFPLFLLITIIKSYSNKTKFPPSPLKLPIIGNLHQLDRPPHRSLRGLSEKHGNLMLLYLGRVPTLVVSSADMAREIMKTHDLTFASRPPSKAIRILHSGAMGLGFVPYGEHWRQMRKLTITHLLSTKMVQSFGLAREEEVELMIDKISSRSASVVDMSDVLYSFTNDIICRVVSGKFFRKEGRNEMFRRLTGENSALLGKFHVEDFLPWLSWLDVFFGLNARAERISKEWDDVFEETIRDHAERAKGNEHEGDDFIDVLLSLQKNPDMDYILNKGNMKALLMGMFSAGTDTSYILLEWAMAELLQKPEAMKKLRDEAHRLSGGQSIIREENLNEMSYLKAVVKEVLRLHPPAPLLLPHESREECEIQGYKIPKGARVIINAWAIGRDPKSWDSPEEFWPERFLVSGSPDFKGNDFQFIPFGAGRRICPGLNFSVITAELALANLVHRFHWELPAGMRSKGLDMTENEGLTTPKKQRLCLIMKPLLI
nr:cytochrome P450 [Paris polyphylla]